MTQKEIKDWLDNNNLLNSGLVIDENHRISLYLSDVLHQFTQDYHDKLIADIKNKLTPVKNLCALLKESELMYDLDVKKHKLIEKEIEQVLKTVEYLNNLKLK